VGEGDELRRDAQAGELRRDEQRMISVSGSVEGDLRESRGEVAGVLP
jgi:hypothetical protein